jgi:hypothetical protein
LWSAITTIITIAASPFGWDRDTTGITIIIITIITIAGIEKSIGHPDPDALFILRPRAGFDAFSGSSHCASVTLAGDGSFKSDFGAQIDWRRLT